MLTSRGDPKQLEQGKAAISNAVIGLIIAFAAWLIVNTLLVTLGFQVPFKNAMPWNEFPTCEAAITPLPPGPVREACDQTKTPTRTCTTPSGESGINVCNPGGWSPTCSVSCDTGGDAASDIGRTRACTTGGCPGTQECSTLKGGRFWAGCLAASGCTPTPGVSGSIGDTDGFPADPAYEAAQTPPEGSAYDQGEVYTSCALSKLTPYAASIQGAAAANGIPPARIQAIILAESSGNPSAESSKNAQGLMQILPSTARTLDPSLASASDQQIIQQLRNPDYNIKLGTAYYKQLLNKYGGPDLASASYNGGYLANRDSVNCPGLRRWQCPWDNNAQTVPNTGYKPTRDYVTTINDLQGKISGTPGQCT